MQAGRVWTTRPGEDREYLMITNLAEVIRPHFRFSVAALLFGMMFAAVLEAIGLSSIPAFIAILLDPDQFFKLIASMGIVLEAPQMGREGFVYFGGGLIIMLFLVKAVFLSGTMIFEAMLMKSISIDIADRLFWRYVHAPYLFHVKNNSAFMVRNVTKEVEEVRAIIRALLLTIREGLVLVAAIVLLLVTVPFVLTLVLALFVGSAALFYLLLRRSLARRGKLAQEHRGEQIKVFAEALGSIKILKLFFAELEASRTFFKHTKGKETNTQFQQVVGAMPRVLLELLGVIVVLGVAGWYTAGGYPVEQTLPTISLLGVVVVRLVPSLTTLTAAMSTIRFQRPSLDLIASEIRDADQYSLEHARSISKPATVNSGATISLKDVDFRYGLGEAKVLDGINLELSVGQIYGVVGVSGAGKSTLLDLLLNLIQPTSGSITFDGEFLDESDLNWWSMVGYAPQDNFLIDDSLRRNVAFGVPDELVDLDRLQKAIDMAKLEKVLEKLPQGLSTLLGERGMSLSGGQRQRVGLARAFYRQSPILILDEATSALDAGTESEVLQAVREAPFIKLIILVTHRVESLRDANKIVVVENGRANTFDVKDYFALPHARRSGVVSKKKEINLVNEEKS